MMRTPKKLSTKYTNRGQKILVASLFFTIASIPSIGNAKIYKCAGDSGKVNFQDKPCVNGDSKVVSLNKINTMDKNKQVENQKLTAKTVKAKKNSQANKNYRYDKQNTMICDQAKTAYENEVAQIKARCKKGRETFCNKSAEEIQKTWDNNFLKKERGGPFRQPSQNWYAFHRNGGAPIFNLKTQIAHYCQ